VLAAAVILHPARPIAGLADSKKLSEPERTRLAAAVRSHSLAWALGRAEVWEIDHLNIRQASLLAMTRAIAALNTVPEYVVADGTQKPGAPCRVSAIPGGDGEIPCISAASILAKVARDREMAAWHGVYPNYGFDAHKGYATPVHCAALARFGPCPLHRHSFAPVRLCLDGAHWFSLHGERGETLNGDES
jgi:ribonuclease HII